MAAKHRVFAIVSLSVFAVDRVTKTWAQFTLDVGERLDVIPGFFYLTHVRNPGAAFGLFADVMPEIKAIAFAGVASLALVIVLLQLRSLAPGEKAEAAALAAIAGGAMGNLLDRLPGIGTAEVIDFLHFELWSGYPWPDFNIADVAIVLGVVGLIVDLIARESMSSDVKEGETGIDVDESQA